jgi:hypothetical protein
MQAVAAIRYVVAGSRPMTRQGIEVQSTLLLRRPTHTHFPHPMSKDDPVQLGEKGSNVRGHGERDDEEKASALASGNVWEHSV